MKMEAPGSSKTLVNMCHTAQYHIQEELELFTFYAVLDTAQLKNKKSLQRTNML
jgi:hypothetical protein